MIKEDLYKQMRRSCGINEDEATYHLDEFFSQNICIPKGTNRHPYADVYHEAVEGKELQWSENGINWFDVVPPNYMYRIKPSEPVYEWQYGVLKEYANEIKELRWMTEKEAGTNPYYIKVEETKRIRK